MVRRAEERMTARKPDFYTYLDGNQKQDPWQRGSSKCASHSDGRVIRLIDRMIYIVDHSTSLPMIRHTLAREDLRAAIK